MKPTAANTTTPVSTDTLFNEELPLFVKALIGQGDLEVIHASMQAQLEGLSEKLRLAILKCDFKQLLGFLWGQLLSSQLARMEEDALAGPAEMLSDVMFALEYVHAVLSSHPTVEHGDSASEEDLSAVLEVSTELRSKTLQYCLVAARRMPEGLFGPETGTLAMQAMTSWVTIRGHRYQSLEAEFFEFVLKPHEAALRAAYGVGAQEIAQGIQAAVDATRFGHMAAIETLGSAADRAYELAEQSGLPIEEVVSQLQAEESSKYEEAVGAVSDLLLGGICNVANTSGLPAELLSDLAHFPGDENEFFAPGPLRGTPLRRMPGRVKPLIAVENGVYACDGNFLRDSAYRALQWGLLGRLPDYKNEWANRQTEMSEGAFTHIFQRQLTGAEVLTSVYYPDPDTGSWVENDVLIVHGDVLLQVEVKAGVMPMHSPEVHFERHVRTIEALVIKAHTQCSRFLRYADSAPEVPIFTLVDGQHKEVRRLRLGDYRVVVPIGLTVEAFTPFSSMSKRLPAVQPILGKYPFISMSIDDLFVLSRLLPTTGELMHYLTVRQGVAGVPQAMVFDELDHLGAYIAYNRVDHFYKQELAKKAASLTHADACAPVDEYFADPDWESREPPRQEFPALLKQFLAANDEARGPRFLAADAAVRDLALDGRRELAQKISEVLPSLRHHPYRWFLLLGQEPLLVWVQREKYVDVASTCRTKAEAACLAARSKSCTLLVLYVRHDESFAGGWSSRVSAPHLSVGRYGELVAHATRMQSRATATNPEGWLQLTRRRSNLRF